MVVGITQGYAQIGLYRDVMVPEGREEEFLNGVTKDGNGGSPLRGYSGSRTPPSRSVLDDEILSQGRVESGNREEEDTAELRVQVDKDLDHLLAFKAREELEEVYGMPAIVCLLSYCLGLHTDLFLQL